MRYQRLAHPIATTTVVLLFLVGCSAPAATPAPSTAIPPTPTLAPSVMTAPTPTSAPSKVIPPTPTPPVLITNAEMLIGNWQPLSKSSDAMFLQINSDGTCRQSYSFERLTSVPQVECTYTFEGKNLAMTAVKLNGVPPCPSPTGKYEVRLMADNQIELVAAQDPCAPRIRSTRGLYQRIP